MQPTAAEEEMARVCSRGKRLSGQEGGQLPEQKRIHGVERSKIDRVSSSALSKRASTSAPVQPSRSEIGLERCWCCNVKKD